MPDSLLDDLLHMLGRADSRARHIHAYVTHGDHHVLTHQIHFEGDPLVDTVSEGAIARDLIHRAELHDDPAARLALPGQGTAQARPGPRRMRSGSVVTRRSPWVSARVAVGRGTGGG
ncbi:hypothetical protein IM697_23510 [Streptomyces ferrugineus]|uniref:Uncharacterized protein n=1 Tax=Streptomyces ferrugineus TaxID=1413221 RepID=A0A7M2SA96_9ACTN|nr:hypothetical protein [Streptomyces ferrugineus]QOV33216.1 hypothetical protein IM697_23510 [Streptomyces ferrugineus]